MKRIAAKYITQWDNSIIHTSECEVDLDTRRLISIVPAPMDVEVNELTDEFIMLPDGTTWKEWDI